MQNARNHAQSPISDRRHQGIPPCSALRGIDEPSRIKEGSILTAASWGPPFRRGEVERAPLNAALRLKHQLPGSGEDHGSHCQHTHAEVERAACRKLPSPKGAPEAHLRSTSNPPPICRDSAVCGAMDHGIVCPHSGPRCAAETQLEPACRFAGPWRCGLGLGMPRQRPLLRVAHGLDCDREREIHGLGGRGTVHTASERRSVGSSCTDIKW